MTAPTSHRVWERHHRLPKHLYAGEAIVALTACVLGRKTLFSDSGVVEGFAADLRWAAARHSCAVVVYCFMPDHLHVLFQGTSPVADLWRAMVLFKQRTGYWLRTNRPGVRWQKDFHDRVVRREENLVDHIRYIVENPVRQGLVQDWRAYPFLDSDMFDLEELFGAA